jgi:hypothetical protein
VANIEDDAALLGRARGRNELAVLHDIVAGAAVRMRENVAGRSRSRPSAGFPTTLSVIRTFTPSTVSGFFASVFAHASTFA